MSPPISTISIVLLSLPLTVPIILSYRPQLSKFRFAGAGRCCTPLHASANRHLRRPASLLLTSLPSRVYTATISFLPSLRFRHPYCTISLTLRASTVISFASLVCYPCYPASPPPPFSSSYVYTEVIITLSSILPFPPLPVWSFIPSMSPSLPFLSFPHI